MKNKLYFGTLAVGSLILASGCSTTQEPKSVESNMPRAVAVLAPASGSQVKGQIQFLQEKDGVKVIANITGLKEGQHGFHIHEKGDCSAPDATSAGPHFNPTAAPHGGPMAGQH